MSVVCGSCERNNREDAKFCDSCGTRLDTAQAGAPAEAPRVELRWGTFVFCDMVQSTALANRIGLEELRQVFRWFRERVAAVSRQHGGHLIRFVGDGAFLSFGLPRASEDATEAAVQSGLSLVREISEGEPIPGLRLALRVGIASGTVVYGDVIEGAAIKEESIVGSVAHLAARLAAAAPPDGVVISDLTRRAIGQFFECRDIGRIDLKGFDGGERVWQVIAETQIASRFVARQGHETSSDLVNCVEVMAALNAAWAQALAGRGNAVILAGDPGIGKSKVARTLRAQAMQAHTTVLEIDCTPSTRNTPLFPVSVLMRRMAGIRPDDSDTERLRKAALLMERFDTLPEAAGALTYLAPILGISRTAPPERGDSAERVRERTIALLVDMLTSMMRGGPFFMLCEDMHWADASTTLVVQRMCEAMDSLPALVVATVRPEPDNAAFELPNARRIALAALDDHCAQAMVRLLTPAAALDEPAIARIIERAEGVPLFLEELCRSELDAANQPPLPASGRTRVTAVPQILQAIIEARLDRAQNIKPIIQAASVIGREFPLPLLAELLPEHRAGLGDAVARLVDAGLLTAGIDERTSQMSFRHALIRDAVYETLLLEDRQRLHGQAAQLLVQHFDRLPESAPDLVAHHLMAANRFDEAVVSLIAAGALASARAAYRESASHSRTALGLLDKLEDTRRRTQLELQLLIQLGVAICATQGYTAPEVEATYRRARSLVHDDHDPAQAFAGVRGLATYHFVRNEQDLADETSTLGLAMAHRAGRVDLVIEALTVRGYTDLYTGRIDAAQQRLQECADLYRANDGERFDYPSVQDAGTAAWSLLGTACWLRGDSQGAERSIEQLTAHLEKLARPFDTAYANCFVAQQLNIQRRHADARRHAGVCVELSQRHGFTTWLVCGLMQQAIAAASLAPSQEAVDGLRGAIGAFLGAGAQASMPFFQWGLARGLRQLGDLDGARAALNEGLARAKSTGETYLIPELLILESELEASDGAAARLLEEARLLAVEQGATVLALRAALTALRRRGGKSDDPHRDATAWLVLEGEAPSPADPDWARKALRGATQALGTGRGGP